jgi:hypothetical protein
MKPKPHSKPEPKLTRQEMDAALIHLARKTVEVLTEGARQSIIDGNPDVEVEHVMSEAWRLSPKAVCEELLHRGLIAEVKKVLERERMQ